jgi:sugar O-acyltransferase (sialic acid O-acetyltransferase NeuD family)
MFGIFESKKSPLFIIGAGGFSREVLMLLQREHGFYGFIVVDQQFGDTFLCGFPVFTGFPMSRARFIVAVGDPATREKLWKRALEAGWTPEEAVVAPSATVGPRTEIGPGSVICDGTRVTCDVKIGSSVILNLNSTVGHDSEIGSFSTVSPGALISGNVKISPLSYIGSGAVLREHVKIPSLTVIGMGAVVTKSLEGSGVYVGNPARLLVKPN